MKSIYLIFISLFFTVEVHGGDPCHPKEVKKVAESITARMDASTLEYNKEVDRFWSSERFNYFNYKDIEPAILYANKKGCQLHEGYAKEAMNEYIYNLINNKKICFSEIVDSYIEEACTFSEDSELDGVYIPKDIDDCIKELDKILDHETRLKIKVDSLDGFHEYELGRYLQNNWGLWGNTRLKKYFKDLSIENPDIISDLIFKTYRNYLNGTYFDFKKEVNDLAQDLNQDGPPQLKDFPKEARNLRHQMSSYPDPELPHEYGSVYAYTTEDESEYWIFNNELGWVKISPEVYLSRESQNRTTWLKNIYGIK